MRYGNSSEGPFFLSVFRDKAAEADRKKGTEKIAKAFEGSVQSRVREALAGSFLAALPPRMSGYLFMGSA